MKLVHEESGREMHLTYCTNAHPGGEVDDIEENLRQYVEPLRKQLEVDRLGLGLWLGRTAVDRLSRSNDRRKQFQKALKDMGLYVFTLNCFPYGQFHRFRVKEEVFRPSWRQAARVEYTHIAAEVLAELLPDDLDRGTISTMPVDWKPWGDQITARRDSAMGLRETVRRMMMLKEDTGKSIQICLEPEPGCTLETTDDVIEFILEDVGSILDEDGSPPTAEHVREHLGMCFDTCHLACQYESLSRSLKSLKKAGVTVGKAQLTCALKLKDPGEDDEAVEILRGFDEPRYLHQVCAKATNGEIVRSPDLTDVFGQTLDSWRNAEEWRIHFHVPIHMRTAGGLKTTQRELRQGIKALVKDATVDHMEIETYTWDVLPESEIPRTDRDLVAGLAREFRWVLAEFEKNGVVPA